MDAVTNVSVGIAFIAGLLSFISPCVLPLVPAYVSYMGSRASLQTTRELALAGTGGATVAVSSGNRLGLFLHGLMFVFGLTFFFVVFGILINVPLAALNRTSYDIQTFLRQAGGILAILFGLYVLGVVNIVLNFLINRFAWEDAGSIGMATLKGLKRLQGMLYSDTRRQVNPRNPYGYAGSALMGLAFAAGWTPCIAPTYGTILTMINNFNVGQAILPLIAFSIGLGFPFLIAALALNRVRGFFKRIQRHMRVVEVVSGVLMIGVGILLFTNRMSELAQFGTGFNTVTGNLESCTVSVLSSEIPSSDYSICMQLGPNYKYVTPVPSQGSFLPPQDNYVTIRLEWDAPQRS